MNGRWLSLCVALIALPSCSYRIGPGARGEAWTSELERVAVPIFANQSFRQGLEFDLTRHFISELQLRTPVQVVGEGDAQASVEGMILAIRDRVREEDRDDRILASQVEVSAEVRVVFRDGRRMMGPVRHLEIAEFVRFRGEDRATATREALRDLARELVLRLAVMRATPATDDGGGSGTAKRSSVTN